MFTQVDQSLERTRGGLGIGLSRWGQEEDRRSSLEAGFDSPLVKPIEPATLETLLARLQPAAAELPRG